MLFKLSWKNIISKPLTSGLSILLISSAIIIILITLLTSFQINEKFEKNSAEIDLVIGAKGSRLQLVLCNIYHVDQPTGNINYARTNIIRNHPFVKMAIPISLGDNYKSYRIVGTDLTYIDSLYKGELEIGRKWNSPLEVVLGSSVANKLGLNIDDEFVGGHGIGESIHSHDESKYKVVGVLKKNNSVIDNLILTSLESVWVVHGVEDKEKGSFNLKSKNEVEASHEDHHHHDHDHDHNHHDHGIHQTPAATLKELDKKTLEITSLLIFYNSPRGKFTVPGMANNAEGMMAAEPSIEIQQLIQLIEPAISVLKNMSFLVIFIASFSMFVAMLNSLKNRKYEISLMRVLGASKIQIFSSIIMEGLIISVFGFLFGVFLSHIGMEVFSGYLSESYHYDFTGFIWLDIEWSLFGGCLIIGTISALYPAIKAYQIDISKTLSKIES
jgi:putative ABC transport system permease protein